MAKIEKIIEDRDSSKRAYENLSERFAYDDLPGHAQGDYLEDIGNKLFQQYMRLSKSENTTQVFTTSSRDFPALQAPKHKVPYN